MFFSIFASLTLDNSHFLQNILSSNIITIIKLCVTIIIIVIIIYYYHHHHYKNYHCCRAHYFLVSMQQKRKMKSENVRKNGFALCMFDHYLS